MIQLLLIFGIACIAYEGAWGEGLWPVGFADGVLIVCSPLAFLFGVAWASGESGGAGIDHGNFAACRRAERLLLGLRLLGTAWYCFCVLSMGWHSAVRGAVGDMIVLDEAITLAPLLCYLVGIYWASHPIEHRIRVSVLWRDLHRGLPVYAPLTRAKALWQSVRHHMLLVLVPVTIILGWSEIFARYIRDARVFETIHPPLRDATVDAVHYVGIVAAVFLSPLIIATLWDTVRLRSGTLVERFRAMCASNRVRVVGPYVWRTGGSMINGAILGFFWPARFLLLTDGLLDRLADDEVESVLAHEIAHVKHRHLPWLAASLIATVLVAGWAGTLFATIFSLKPEDSLFEFLLTASTLAAALGTFGFVSRRFEWQADAFAASHLSTSAGSEVITPGAASTLAGALGAVADLNGIPVESLSWRHGSIAQRQARLRALVGRPVKNLAIDRHCGWIKRATLLTLLVAGGPLVFAAFEHARGQ
ncbi:MAG: M48 family metalloprotease [Phycisphaeraceae bacterium]|nr:M48 family metalloprotease [Phycisphaeraceae bacterium]